MGACVGVPWVVAPCEGVVEDLTVPEDLADPDVGSQEVLVDLEEGEAVVDVEASEWMTGGEAVEVVGAVEAGEKRMTESQRGSMLLCPGWMLRDLQGRLGPTRSQKLKSECRSSWGGI